LVTIHSHYKRQTTYHDNSQTLQYNCNVWLKTASSWKHYKILETEDYHMHIIKNYHYICEDVTRKVTEVTLSQRSLALCILHITTTLASVHKLLIARSRTHWNYICCALCCFNNFNEPCIQFIFLILTK